MSGFVLKRVLQAVFVLLVVTLFVSYAVRLTGDPALMLSQGAGSVTEQDLENIRKGLRQLIGGVWMPPVRKSLDLNESDARAYAWMTVMAFWGMRQLVRDGEISRVRGMKLFNDLVERIARQ